jgi:L-iduronidase
MKMEIDCTSDHGPLQIFWNSTGFTPATLLLTEDMRQQVLFWGAIPRSGLRFARVHFLLELVNVTFVGENAPQYVWSRLDQGLDLLVQNGMAPIFELMGNPNGQFNDFNDDLQLRRWRNLVRDVALHLIDRYGMDEVESWYFESWNEPDGGFGWRQQWPQDEASFCNYYDACVDGLAAASPRLTIGGPGTCQTLSSLFRAFLAHCDHGENYFSHQKGTRLDFISIHEKALKPHKENLNPRTTDLLLREEEIVTYIRKNHSRFASLPFMNNECDPQVGWKDHHTWHATSYYASWICKSVFRHMQQLADNMGVDYALLGNDHGFIGEWGHRTLLARFGQSGWIEDGQGSHVDRRGWEANDFTTPNFCLVKKPAYTVMTLLSLLVDGSKHNWRLDCQASEPQVQQASDSELGVMAARAEDGGVAVLLYYSRDRINTSGNEPVALWVKNLPFQQAMLIHYRIDEEHNNPYAAWEEAGAPDFPAEKLLSQMRSLQEAQLLEEPREITTPAGFTHLEFDLPLHGVSLLLLLPRPSQAPAVVTGLRYFAFHGLNGKVEHMLRWDPLPSRAIRGYEVQFAPSADASFERVYAIDLLCATFILPDTPGFYRLAARDYWGRVGVASNIVQVGKIAA